MVMKEKNIIQLISQIELEYDYDEDIVFSKFVKKHGENYTREEFLKFLRRRYEVINKYNNPDDVRFGVDDDQLD